MILRVEIISCITIIMIIFIVMMNTVCIETVFSSFFLIIEMCATVECRISEPNKKSYDGYMRRGRIFTY